MPPTRSPSPLPPKSTLWKDAYEELASDPDNGRTIEGFAAVVKKQCGIVPDFRTEAGRKQLLPIIDHKKTKIERRKLSPKGAKVCDIVGRLRGLITTGAAGNPFSSVAVAGVFVAFDIIQMHEAQKDAIFGITIDTADIITRAAAEDYHVEIKSRSESEKVKDLRKTLRARYRQLYSKILYLTMKISYKLDSYDSWYNGWLIGTSNWQAHYADLEKLESRVNKTLTTLRGEIGTALPPSWKIKDKQETKLHRLVKNGRTDDVWNMIEEGKCKELVDGKAMLNAKTSKGWTALMFAVDRGHWKITTWLLEVHGIWVNARNTDGNTALILAAQKKRTGYVKKLLGSRAKPDIRNNRQRTAFLEAAMRNNLEVMKALVEKGDDINQVTGKNGWCALHTAVENNNVEMAQWLIEQKIKKHIKITGGKRVGMTPKELAMDLNRTEMLAMLS